ncbi:MAG: HlyD family efflux transporter periplasmic adaptor subunit [Bacteroidota bacterium]
MNRKTITIILVGLGSIICLALVSSQSSNSSRKEGERDAGPVKLTQDQGVGLRLGKDDLKLLRVNAIDRAVERPISGRVVPKNTTQLFSEVQGKVVGTEFRLKEGVTFKQGETLVRLDAQEFKLELEAKRSAFLNILTGIMPDLKADYPQNYPSWLGYVEQYKSGESLKELPKTLTNGEKYFVTSNQVYSTFFSIKSLEERLAKFNIIAPYGGSVTSSQVDKGSLVSPGQALATIINNKHFELETATGIEVVSKLQIGDKIAFGSNELEGEWVGTVVRINDVIDPKTQNVPVYFEMEGPNLRAGMYLEGYFTSTAYESVFSIPANMLTRDEKVLLLEDNTIRAKAVELVEFTQDSILVRGLSDGDQLIINRFNVPVEGMKLSL